MKVLPLRFLAVKEPERVVLVEYFSCDDGAYGLSL
jgi:hypothetical protein